MKTFEIVTDEKKVIFNFPTSLNEITEEYLLGVTANVKVAENYTLVGVVYHESLGSIIIARKQSKKSITSGVVPIFIKTSDESSAFIKEAKCKDKIIIASSQLALAHHVVAPKNTLSLDYFIRNLDNDTFIAQRMHNNYGKEECYFVEFKLVPNCDIVGYYNSTNVEVNNPYINFESTSEGA